jgi:hypothetical protein
MRICTEEQYLAEHGADRSTIGEPGAHKYHSRQSRKQWQRTVDRLDAQAAAAVDRRQQLRDEYAAKCAAGELRPPNRREKLEQIAAGHPDNESTQAARRILARYNMEYLEALP